MRLSPNFGDEMWNTRSKNNLMAFSNLWQHSFPLPKQYFHFEVKVCDSAVMVLDNIARRMTCLEIADGAQRWTRQRAVAERANTVKGATDGILVMSEYRGNDGPWGAAFGVYRYDFESGDFLGASHGKGGWGKFVRLLDWVPDFTNELRQTPIAVRDGKIYTDAMRILDARTGEVVGELTGEQAEQMRHNVAQREHQLTISDKQVALEDGAVLQAGTPDDPDLEKHHYQHRPLQFFRQNAAGQVEWTFDGLARGWDTPVGQSTRILQRFDGDSIVMIVRQGNTYAPGEPFKSVAVACFLTRLDLKTGETGPQIPLAPHPLLQVQLHAAWDGKVLVSWSDAEAKTWELHLIQMEN